MADFTNILGELALGATDLEGVRKWIDDAIARGADGQSLLAELEAAAEQLPEDSVTALRAKLSGQDSGDEGGMDFDFDIAIPDESDDSDKTQADPETADFSGELSLEDAPADETATSAEADAPDSDKTVIDTSMQSTAAAEETPASYATVVESQQGGGDKTEVVPASNPDATVVTPTNDKTEVVNPQEPVDPDKTVISDGDPTIRGQGKAQGNDYDPFAMGNSTQPGGASTPTGTGWPTGTAWPGQGGGHDPDSIGPGTILKDRFELLSAIGEGGMGMVYKARDLLKVEAKDRNPYIAVKLLSGDFREHPEAFIALQRESSKAQKLAHPNIATVYDFDRDGSTVYMTMELLEGEELAQYIKKLPPGGLPSEEALRVIMQLCDGLEYAHARGLVHSDFKPGNCFALSDGTVKILDFGIARASKTRADAAGETTVFDPGQLGALTPAYATPEMFEGMDSDPRDDIYALGAVAWELLQGKHPFNKLSSVKAMEKGLSPQPFTKPGFTKRQAKALIKSLEFKRENRTASVEEFREGVKFKKNKAPMYIAIGVLAAGVFGALAYNPIIQTLEDRKNAEIISQIESGQLAIPDALQQMQEFSDRAQRNLLEDGKDTIIGYFERQAESEVNASEGKFDYPAAQKIINEAGQYYKDSAQLQSIQTRLSDDRASLIAKLTSDFDQYLEEDRLMPLPDEEDITDLLARMRQADPGNTLLSDARLTQRYASLVESAVAANEWQRAKDILTVSLNYSPEDASLLNLDDKVTRELKRQADEKLVAEIKTRLAAARGSLDSVNDYAGIVDDLLQLEQLRPEDPVLTSLQKQLRSAVVASLEADIAAGNWDKAEANMLTFAQMFPVTTLMEKRGELSRAEIETGYQPAQLSDRLAALEQRRQQIQGLLQKKTFDSAWDDKLRANFKESIALLRPGNTWFSNLQDSIVSAYIEQARKLVEADRFDAARRTLESGEQFKPEMADRFADERNALASAEKDFQRDQQERIRLARIAAQKNNLKVQAEANDVTNAAATFETLKAELPENDPFVTTEAPELLATAYERLASTQGERGNYSNAVQFARKGLEYAPDRDGLKSALSQYSNLAEREELMSFAASATASNLSQMPAKIQRVRGLFPDDATAISNEVIRNLADRIKRLEGTDISAANELWAAAKNLYPGNRALEGLSIKAPPRPSKYVPNAREAMNKNQLSAAQGILATAQKEEPGNQQVSQFATELKDRQNQANQYFVSYQQLMRQGQKSQAKLYLDQALRLWVDNDQYKQEMASNFTTTTAPTRSADGSRPCSANLAGYGRSGRAVCFDMLNGNVRGPEMVVVPPGGSFSKAFAIGKYEVSVGEFNAFCNASRQCQAVAGNTELPITNIPYTQMQAYASWLANSTGKNYRIPTVAEWEYAASANNPGAVKDFNCRVTQGGQVLKGLTLLEVKSGRPNPWGLTNYVGNAQEAVQSGGGVVARGGAFEDNLSACDIKLSRSWNGAPNELSGFRLARDID